MNMIYWLLCMDVDINIQLFASFSIQMPLEIPNPKIFSVLGFSLKKKT